MASPYLFLLEALRAHCKLPPFPDPVPSSQLTLELQDGPAVSIDFNEEASMVVLFSEIGTYQEEKERDILAAIAEANFLWAATNGATLSARPEVQTVYLAQQMPISVLDGEGFIAFVEKFVATSQQWQTILSEKEEEKNTQATEESETTGLTAMIDKA